jgi:hypothetical protein
MGAHEKQRAKAGPRIRRLGRRAALSIALAGAVGCQTWRQVPAAAPAPGTARQLPDRVRVTRADLTVQELRRVRMVRDSLIGYARPAGAGDSVRVALALAEVRRIEARGTRPVATVGLFFGVLLAVGIVATASAGPEGW